MLVGRGDLKSFLSYQHDMTFIKGQKAWNKGLKGYLVGNKNPMYGKTHTKEALLKIIKANLGTKDSGETKLKKSLSHQGIRPADWGAGFKKGNVPWNKESWKNAYYAGLVDGEGNIGIVNNSPKTENEKYKKVVLRIQMVDGVEVLKELKSVFGGWIYKRERSKKNPKWSDSWEWVIQNKCLDKFLGSIRPYIRIKKRQVEIVLEYRKLQKKKRTINSGGIGLNTIPDFELEYRKKLEMELKSLKLNKGKK